MRVDLYGATRRMIWKARGDERIKGFDRFQLVGVRFLEVGDEIGDGPLLYGVKR